MTKTYLFFDTETTGLPVNKRASLTNFSNWPRLVQIAWLISDDKGKVKSRRSYTIRPDGFTIPAQATAVHGISTNHANFYGDNLDMILSGFHKLVDEADVIVAHNLEFDINIMASEFLRNGFTNNFVGKKAICTMQNSIDFCAIPTRWGFKYPKLSELYEKLFNTPLLNAHDALVDIEAGAKCFWEMKRRQML